MKGYKDSTKVQYMKGGSCEGYAKGGHAGIKGAAKIAKVMGEFKRGDLHSGSKKGPEVTSKKQATAIALNEARKAGLKIPVKKAHGGMAESTSSAPTDAKGRRLTIDDLNRMNRDVGGMNAADMKRTGEAVARGNRMQAEEAGESRMVRKMPPRDPRVPLIKRAGGGLAVMPRGKKGC